MTERELDPGAYIGREPELASETIPGGVEPEDDRVAFNASQRAVDGEPDVAEPAEPRAAREPASTVDPSARARPREEATVPAPSAPVTGKLVDSPTAAASRSSG